MLTEVRASDLQLSNAVAKAVLGHSQLVSNDSIRLLNKPGPTTTGPAKAGHYDCGEKEAAGVEHY
jgi:hypothetical protein